MASVRSGYLREEPLAGASLGALVTSGTAGAGGTPATGGVYDPISGATAVPKYAKLNQAALGAAATLVAAVAGKKIRVMSAVFVAGATATDLTFNSAATAISALFANAANGGTTLPFSPAGWFETATGEALTVTTGAGSTTGIQVVYIEV